MDGPDVQSGNGHPATPLNVSLSSGVNATEFFNAPFIHWRMLSFTHFLRSVHIFAELICHGF
jgi:hypothetical protein